MNSKAIRKQLLAAVAMVLVAAVALGSSTYAWFANNNKVTATDMQVTAMSNQSFLLISSTKTTATEIQAENKTTTALTVSDAEAKLFPAAHATISKTSDAAIDQDNWYTAFSADPAQVAMDSSTKTTLTAYTNYVIHKQVWITVAKNSTPVENLKVKATIANKASGDITQAKVLVTSATAAAEMSSASAEPATVLTNTQISDSTVVPLDIYIFIDGNDSAVYTNNYDHLDTATISLEFSATTVAA